MEQQARIWEKTLKNANWHKGMALIDKNAGDCDAIFLYQ